MSLWYDLRLIARTAWTILQIAAGRRNFSEPVEMPEARQLRTLTLNSPVHTRRTDSGTSA
jgi:hypothetical protein